MLSFLEFFTEEMTKKTPTFLLKFFVGDEGFEPPTLPIASGCSKLLI